MAQKNHEALKLYSIIDIKSLIDFYKDDNDPDWGIDPDNPCKADSFYKFIASDCFFTGSTGNIPVLEQDCVYKWEVYGFNGKLFTLKSIGGESNNVIVLEKVKKGDSKEWEDIFELGDNCGKTNGKLIMYESKKDEGIITIKTKPKPKPELNPGVTSSPPSDAKFINLSYTINFMFKDLDGKKRYGRIDPFIKIRSDDDPEP